MRCCVFALTLVVGFMTGFFIPVASDLFVNGWAVTPRYQVAHRAEMTGQAVAQITQPPTPDPALKERRDATPVAGAAAALKKAVPPSSTESSLTSLQYAAEGGHPVAQWKLGRMYAEGDGVVQDALRAFEYFSRIANAHAEDSPASPQAAIVANAFVALGRYYLKGIPN